MRWELGLVFTKLDFTWTPPGMAGNEEEWLGMVGILMIFFFCWEWVGIY